MMTQAFYTGISGLKASSSGIDIIADNLANVDTIGFKGNAYEFSSMFQKMINTDSGTTSVDSGVGIGVGLQATPMIEKSGSLLLSERSTDIALLGDGWFGMQGEGEPIYTRDGTFSFDAKDDLVSIDGFHVLGTLGNNISEDNILTETLSTVDLGDIGAQEKLRFPKTLSFPPVPTTNASFSGNLGTLNEVRAMSATIVDPQSNINNLRLEFTKAENQIDPETQWNVTATTKSLDGNTIYDTQTGTVNFDNSGAIVSTTLTSIDNNGSTVNIDLGAGFIGLTSISSIPVTTSSSSDGTIGGDLQGYDINKNGDVIATFTNGIQSGVGKIAVYHFQNDQGLARLTGTRFQQTANSGEAIFYKNPEGKNIIGTDITNFKLEGSNIEMSYGLTELIVLQRSYDANSKSISTADQMMQKALSMDA